MKVPTPTRRPGLLVLLLLSAFPVLLADPLSAQTLELRLDPEAIDIELSLTATLHTVRGTAELERGRLLFDAAGGAVEGEIVVDARSVDTGNARRDRKMHRDVLESERFETVELHPRRLLDPIVPGQSRTVRLQAELQIHGSRHAIELPVEVDWRSDEETLHFRFALSLPYVEWGMEDPSTFLLKVGKEVEITVEGSASVSTEEIGEASPRCDRVVGCARISRHEKEETQGLAPRSRSRIPPSSGGTPG